MCVKKSLEALASQDVQYTVRTYEQDIASLVGPVCQEMHVGELRAQLLQLQPDLLVGFPPAALGPAAARPPALCLRAVKLQAIRASTNTEATGAAHMWQ
jgi:hypothetical protein